MVARAAERRGPAKGQLAPSPRRHPHPAWLEQIARAAPEGAAELRQYRRGDRVSRPWRVHRSRYRGRRARGCHPRGGRLHRARRRVRRRRREAPAVVGWSGPRGARVLLVHRDTGGRNRVGGASVGLRGPWRCGDRAESVPQPFSRAWALRRHRRAPPSIRTWHPSASSGTASSPHSTIPDRPLRGTGVGVSGGLAARLG